MFFTNSLSNRSDSQIFKENNTLLYANEKVGPVVSGAIIALSSSLQIAGNYDKIIPRMMDPHQIFLKKISLMFDPLKIREEGLSHYLANKILSNFSMKELGAIASVCKPWKTLIFDSLNDFTLNNLFPKMEIIDEHVWKEHVHLEAYGLSFQDLAPVKTLDLLPKLNRFSTLPIEMEMGFTLLFIPKGLSFNKVSAINESSKQPTPFTVMASAWRDREGDIVTTESYRVLISNSVLERSRNQPAALQQILVQGYGVKMPSLINMTTLVTMYQMVTGKPFFPSSMGMTFTRCSDKAAYWQMVIGWEKGNLHSLHVDALHMDTVAIGYLGVAAMWQI